MSPSKQIENLMEFLESNTNLYQTTFRRVAQSQYNEINKHIAKKGSLDDYILIHKQSISEETEKILMEICKKIIDKNDYSYLFTQIGLFSLFLVPPIYPLIRYAILIYQTPDFNITEFSFCICSICLLLVLLFAAAYSVFKTTFIKKN